MVEAAIEFICDLGRKAQDTSTQQDVSPDEDASIVHQTIQDLIDICSELPVHKVIIILRSLI